MEGGCWGLQHGMRSLQLALEENIEWGSEKIQLLGMSTHVFNSLLFKGEPECMHLGLGRKSNEEAHLISNNWQVFTDNGQGGYSRAERKHHSSTQKCRDTRCGEKASQERTKPGEWESKHAGVLSSLCFHVL